MATSTSTKSPDEPRRRPKPRGGVETFDENALLAELGDDQETHELDEQHVETHEELERRLMREIAAMPDQMALEEAALMRDLASMKEEPDEGDVLMAALLAEEEAERRAKDPKVPDASEIAALRDACLQEKREAVRLKRAGDIDGAKAALRRAKDIAARADAAEATTTTTTEKVEGRRAKVPSTPKTLSAETIEELTRAVDAARREAVARKRAGDMAAARAALTESKELRARLEAAVAAAAAAKNADSEPTEPGEETPEPPTDVDAMIAEAIGTVVKIISDDPDSKVTARKKKSRDGDVEPPDRLRRESDEDEDEDDDDALLRRELGDDYEAQREHWGGDYRQPEPTSERELIASRVEELEGLVDSEKRTALARKRSGDHEGARNALRAMKAAQAELADASAMLAALDD